MVSNRVKRNIWLALSVVSLAVIIDRAIRFADGSVQWWSLLSSVVICFGCVRFYLIFRREVKEGKLFGRQNPFK
ncbi:hypothetical protein [uncultured Duncaniella sp.]|uniref:hypothetical protein n=1 Tax=uncultured Duncaniella sp. TaxID=2768039 RepID=UPI0025CECF95|nr:hypothetical protein [uncultured Duncaniella sp.]